MKTLHEVCLSAARAVALALPVALAMPPLAQAADLGTVTIRTTFRADGRFCPLYLSVSEGLFKREGLTVQVEEGQHGVQVLQTVAAGKDFMSTPVITLLPLIRAQGGRVRAVAVLGQQHPAGVVVHGSGDIQSVRQLAGKRIAVGPGDGATLLPPFLRSSGVDPATVQTVVTDHGAKLQSFLAGKVEAAGIYSEAELAIVRKQDPKARFFPYSSVLSMYGMGLVVNEASIAEKPQAVAAAVRGVLAGERLALANPDKCVDALLAALPGRPWDRAIVLDQLKEHQKLLTAGKEPMGRMTDARWEQIRTLLTQYFGLKGSTGPVGDYYTNQFLPKE